MSAVIAKPVKQAKRKKLLTFENDFASDKERIKYVSDKYSNFSIAKAFSIFYNESVSDELKTQSDEVNSIHNIEIGQVYYGIVEEFTEKGGFVFSLPGVKNDIICKENFSDCEQHVRNYLLTHGNRLLFEAREYTGGKYYVSVINAYYKLWQSNIEYAIKWHTPIEVHIDTLTLSQQGGGGYIGHCDITPLVELTGRSYTHTVFVPGSQIVLNIEADFERWVGETIYALPQKFAEYRKDRYSGLTEMSLVVSRKQLLQNIGKKNLADIYKTYEMTNALKQSDTMKTKITNSAIYDGHVTGVINSASKTGIFVELDNKYITGLCNINDADELLDWPVGTAVKVRIKEFEKQEGRDPIVYNRNNTSEVMFVNVRPVFELVV